MSLNHNTFGAPPAPPAPQHPSWPPGPTGPPPPPLGAYRNRKRWPGILAGAGAGALIAALTAAVITTGVRDTPASPSTTTTTVAAPTTAAPAPLPTAQADRQTCHGWIEAVRLIDAGGNASAPLKGKTLDDPVVQASPELAATAKRVGAFFNQAAAAVQSQLRPGSTPVLEAAATTAVKALAGEADSYESFDSVGGATFDRITNAAAAEMVALCRRLAPL